MKNLCVIPARSGSKRIKDKNIKKFHGKPIITWSISLALESQLFDEVIVSTDDLNIARISEKAGAKIPFLRPKLLADDYTTTIEVMKNVIDNFKTYFFLPDFVCCLYPTSPLLRIEDLTLSYKKILSEKSNSFFCISVAEFPSEIQRAMRIDAKARLKPIDESLEFLRSQDLTRYYYDAGQFYWGHTTAWLENESIHRSSIAFPLRKWPVVDINSEEDWNYAELLYELYQKVKEDEF